MQHRFTWTHLKGTPRRSEQERRGGDDGGRWEVGVGNRGGVGAGNRGGVGAGIEAVGGE